MQEPTEQQHGVQAGNSHRQEKFSSWTEGTRQLCIRPVLLVDQQVNVSNWYVQTEMEALRAEPIPEGEMPASSVQVMSKVLSQHSSNQFLKSVGLQTPSSSKSGSSHESELREQLAAEATAAVQGELDDLRKKIQDAEEERARTQRELEEYKKITEQNTKEMAETNLLIKKLLSLQGNASSST